MKFSFLRPFQAKPVLQQPAPQVIEPLQVIINLEQKDLLKLTNQLDFDINAKTQYFDIPFQLFDLLELDQLFNRKPDPAAGGILYSHFERKQMAMYVLHYFVKARDREDFDMAGAYNRLLSSIMEMATTINAIS